MIALPKHLQAMLEPQLREGEYLGEDGLIRCASCHGLRQVSVALGDRTIRPRALCPCQSAAEEARRQAQKAMELRDRIQKNRALGLPEPLHRSYTFEADKGKNKDLTAKARRYTDAWERMYQEGIGLLILGDVGTGKSFAAGCIANALLDQGVSVLMTNFSRILNALSSLQWGDRNGYIDDLNRYSLLIIDDLGIERSTDYVLEQVYSVIDGRYRSGKPLIVTTNLTLPELKQSRDMAHRRIYDRILERCVPVQAKGENIRRQNAAGNMKAARALLESSTQAAGMKT